MADLLADAVEVVIAVDYDTYTSAAESNVGYGLEAGEDLLWYSFLQTYRSAWWTYRPFHTGGVIVSVAGSSGPTAPTIGIFAGDTLAEMADNVIERYFSGPSTSFWAQSGYTYGIQVGSRYDEDLTYVLAVTGSRSAGPSEVPVAPVRLTLRTVEPASHGLVEAVPAMPWIYFYQPVVEDLDLGVVSAPSAHVGVAALTPLAPITVDAPAAAVAASVAVPTVVVVVSFTLAQPADGSTVPAARPVFVFGVLMEYGVAGLVQLAYDDNDAFTSPVTIEFIPYTIDGNAVNRILAVADLADGSYWWRLRAADDAGLWQDWHTVGEFTVDSSALTGAVAGSLTVTTGDPPVAHLWFVYPAAGVVGDPVTLYGIGLIGDGTETVTIDGVTAAVESQTQVAAGADAYTVDRILEPDTPLVTVEHDEVVVLVPDGTDEGGPLVLVRG